MLDNPSYSYKFFWLEGIVKLIAADKGVVTYEEVIDEMILNAWFPVTEYHIHLTGYYRGEARDNLERAVLLLEQLSGLDSKATKLEVQNALQEHRSNKELSDMKKALTLNVPYKALSGFANHGAERIDCIQGFGEGMG